MINYIRKIRDRIFNITPTQESQPNISTGEESLTDQLVFICRNCDCRTKHLIIGNNSMVNGKYVIERPTGKIIIGDRTSIGGGLFISINEINIGNDVMISWGCTAMDNNAHSMISNERKADYLVWRKEVAENKLGKYKSWINVDSAPIIIRDKAWIGLNCIILKGVTIGEGAVVGAGSVVTKDIPDYAVAAGNPARIIRHTT